MNKRYHWLLILIASLLVSFAIFGNGIKGDFIFDDNIVIVGNPIIERGISGSIEVFKSPYHAHQPRTGLYRPVTIFSYLINYSIFGTSPASFHVVNIILHALVGFFIFLAVKSFADKRVAILSMLLFLVLPIHVEDVTSIVGRAEILALLFVLIAIYGVIKKRYFIASCAFFLGLLSKESAIAFAPIWMFLEYYFHGETLKGVLKKSLYFIPPAILYGLLRFAALGGYFLKNDATPIYNILKFASFPEKLWTSGKILFLYIQKTFIPTVFSPDYSLFQLNIIHNPFSSWESILGLLLLAGIIALAWRGRRSVLGLAAIMFLSSYFVISNLVFTTGTIMAERIFYFSSLGLVIILACAIEQIQTRFGYKNIIYCVISFVLIFYGFKTIKHNRDWINETNLFENAHATAPDSIPNRVNYSYLAYGRKDYVAAENEIEAVLSMAPDHIPALNLAGQINKKIGNIGKAEKYWKHALEINPGYISAYLGLGMLYYENGYFASAESALTDAVAIFPRWSEISYLSLAKTSLKKYDEAIEIITKYYGDDPAQAQLRLALGIAFYKKGDKDQALKYIDESYLPLIEKNTIFRIIDL